MWSCAVNEHKQDRIISGPELASHLALVGHFADRELDGTVVVVPEPFPHLPNPGNPRYGQSARLADDRVPPNGLRNARARSAGFDADYSFRGSGVRLDAASGRRRRWRQQRLGAVDLSTMAREFGQIGGCLSDLSGENLQPAFAAGLRRVAFCTSTAGRNIQPVANFSAAPTGFSPRSNGARQAPVQAKTL